MKRCWCGNEALDLFSAEYGRCAKCETLVCISEPAQADPRVSDDAGDFYGKEYWMSRQQAVYGLPPIDVRARRDMPERCVYWLNALLKLKAPPAKVLEVGSAHGGFVALMRQAGFDAMGLELSPAIVEFARKTFDVPMLLGPVEDQRIEAGSLDAVVLMDVIEHLPDVVGTLRACVKLLKPDGILMVQTPCYPEGSSLDGLEGQRFLQHLKPAEHLNLFSQTGAAKLFEQVGLPTTKFLPPIFWFYDLFAVGARQGIDLNIEQATRVDSTTMAGRMVQALLDGEDRFRDLLGKHRAALEEQAAGRRMRAQMEAEIAALQAKVESLAVARKAA